MKVKPRIRKVDVDIWQCKGGNVTCHANNPHQAFLKWSRDYFDMHRKSFFHKRV